MRIAAAMASLVIHFAICAAEPAPVVFDAGLVYPGSEIEHVFEISNAGPGAMEVVDVRRSCSCSSGEPKPTKVELGGVITLPVRVFAPPDPDAAVRSVFTMHLRTDQGLTTRSLVVQSRTASMIRFPWHGRHAFDQLDLGGLPHEEVVTLKRGAFPVAWSGLAVHVMDGGPLVQARVEPDADRDTWRLLITVGNAGVTGTIPVRLACRFLDGAKALPQQEECLATVTIRGDWRADPSMVMAGVLRTGSTRMTGFRIRSDTPLESDLRVLVVPSSLGEGTIEPDGAVHVTIRAPDHPADLSGWVDIIGHQRTLRVPVVGIAISP